MNLDPFLLFYEIRTIINYNKPLKIHTTYKIDPTVNRTTEVETGDKAGSTSMLKVKYKYIT